MNWKVVGWILIGSWIFYFIFPMFRIFGLPLEIAKDPYYGAGYAIGTFAILGVGIWLVVRKKREKPRR